MSASTEILGFCLGTASPEVLSLALHDDAQVLDDLALSDLDRGRLDQLQRPARRQEFVRSRRLLYTAAARFTHSDPADWGLSNAPGEAPVLCALDPELPALQASLSHGGRWTAVVVSSQFPVGVDIETRERSIQRTGIARYLGWPEIDESRWLEHWTLWEAAAKCARQSVFARRNPAFHALCRSLPDQPPALHHQGHHNHLRLAPDKAHSMSVVVQTPQALRLHS